MRIFVVERIRTLLTIYGDNIDYAQVGVKDNFDRTSKIIYRREDYDVLQIMPFNTIRNMVFEHDEELIIHIYFCHQNDYLEFECGKKPVVDVNEIGKKLSQAMKLCGSNGLVLNDTIIDAFSQFAQIAGGRYDT